MKHTSLKTILTKDEYYDMDIPQLLKIVDALFPQSKKANCYNYTIGKFPNGWRFNVVNSWGNWVDKKLQHQFGNYGNMKHCIIGFLDYIKENNIDPRKLIEK